MSCMLTGSPRPLTGSPFSVNAVCLLMLLDGECRSSTLLATTTPFAFFHGPLPMRLRASTPASPPGAVVERYARQLDLVEPAARASVSGVGRSMHGEGRSTRERATLPPWTPAVLESWLASWAGHFVYNST